MHETIDCPVAVVQRGDEAPVTAARWCRQHLSKGESLTVWTPTARNLKENPALQALTNRAGVETITGRGFDVPGSPGPLIMAWARPDEIDEVMKYASGVTALCVIVGNPDVVRPWADEVGAEVLGDSPWIVAR